MTAKNDNPVDIGAKTLVGCSRSSMLEPKNDGIYVIELCSGELRHRRYLGPGAQSNAWWLDMESGLEFSETSVMYAWRIVGVGSEKFQTDLENSAGLAHGNGSSNKE